MDTAAKEELISDLTSAFEEVLNVLEYNGIDIESSVDAPDDCEFCTDKTIKAIIFSIYELKSLLTQDQ